MKVIIAGSRDGVFQRDVDEAMALCGFQVTEVVSGTARGVDRLGEHWARTHHIPIKPFPADWSKGRAAGPIRNEQMARYADALVAVWDGQTPGTRSMIQAAQRRGLKVFVYSVRPAIVAGTV